ncbi:uncharacterized protein A4U43_C01F35680 [Asparagus officinalis]|uniref:Uncharacterized protein n=1 Tax=Asparagus officinalis TaxID=4686 RepID=A0A5P1FWL2_ASPOF|nr:cyclin-D2-1 [Asparagus officinalis]ONK82057.1 uncharacterized protein A4U43_C01F35680 [Asparagus officinalis]
MPLNIVPDEPGPTFDLLCAEDAGALTDDCDGEYPAGYQTAGAFPDDSNESIAEFLEGESDYSPGFDYRARFRSKSLDLLAREESVLWILKVRAFFRFQPLTAYLAVNYFDRFLSAHHVPEAEGWALPLLSVACLSLAAKMEETSVPSLIDLQVEGTARFIFEPRIVCKMELLVLAALKWRLRSITPFTFIDFFAYKADPSGTCARNLVSHATKIVLATIHDIEFLDHCPSSIAASAIISAAGENPELALIDPGSATSWCIGLTKEGITNCYHLMQESIMENKEKGPLMRVATTVDATSSDASSSSSSLQLPLGKRRKLNSSFLSVDGDKEG